MPHPDVGDTTVDKTKALSPWSLHATGGNRQKAQYRYICYMRSADDRCEEATRAVRGWVTRGAILGGVFGKA